VTDTVRHHVPVLTVPEVAALLGCSDDTVRTMAAAGELPGLKPGRDWVFPAAPLYAALCLHAEKPKAKAKREPPTAVLHEVKRARPPVLP
jgi:excisionase family DNA binding protein